MPEVARGRSEAFGLASLLHLVEGEGVTGRLDLGVGEVALHLGHPVDARMGEERGARALLELFVRTGESFVIETAPVPRAPPLGDVSMLILEGCRLQDEWARLSPMTVLPGAGATLAPPLDALAPYLDGHRTVAEALDAARMARGRAIDPLLAALDAGALVEVQGRPRLAAAELDAAYDEAMDAGRRCVRAGQHAEAAAHFDAALAARPGDRIALQNLRRVAALRGNP